jgi:hypothetical protein
MKFQIKRTELPTLEMFLFKLSYPCHCEIEVSFTDSDEIYFYKTIEIDGHLVLVTQ